MFSCLSFSVLFLYIHDISASKLSPLEAPSALLFHCESIWENESLPPCRDIYGLRGMVLPIISIYVCMHLCMWIYSQSHVNKYIYKYIFMCAFSYFLKYSSRNVQSRNMVSTEQQSKTLQLNIFFNVLNPFSVKHSFNKEICIRLSIDISPASIIVFYV